MADQYDEILAGTVALGYLDCTLLEYARGIKYFVEQESRKPNCDTHLINLLRRAACVGWENISLFKQSSCGTENRMQEEIADRIAREHIGTASYHDAARKLLKDDVLSALRNERDRAFDQGYVCAVANIMNLYGEETVAREVLNANRPKDWSIIDELDMESLQPIFDHEAAQAEIQKLQAIREGRSKT